MSTFIEILKDELRVRKAYAEWAKTSIETYTSAMESSVRDGDMASANRALGQIEHARGVLLAIQSAEAEEIRRGDLQEV